MSDLRLFFPGEERFTRIERKLDELLSFEEKLDDLLALVRQSIVASSELATEVAKMAGEIQNLEVEVSQNASATQSAIVLLNGLKARLDAAIASGDMSKVKELADQLSSNTDALAAAVTANTPSS